MSWLSPLAWLLPWVLLAELHQFRREGQAAQERAEAAITLAAEQGFSFWLALGTLLRGWALAEQGQGEEGIAQIRQGLAAYRATGAEIERPNYLALLAEAYGKVGQAEEGLDVLAEALSWWTKLGSVSTRRSCIGSKGELTLHSQGSRSKVQSASPNAYQSEAEAEACFLKAIDIARKQQAKSLELRAVNEPRPSVAAARQAGLKLTRCYPRSTTGSPKALTPKTCKRRRRC